MNRNIKYKIRVFMTMLLAGSVALLFLITVRVLNNNSNPTVTAISDNKTIYTSTATSLTNSAPESDDIVIKVAYIGNLTDQLGCGNAFPVTTSLGNTYYLRTTRAGNINAGKTYSIKTQAGWCSLFITEASPSQAAPNN